MPGPEDLCNSALYRLGERPIVSLDEGTEKADACQTLYPVVRDAMLSAATWPFATVRQALSRLPQAPPSDFAYYYHLPSSPPYLRMSEPSLEMLRIPFRHELYVDPGEPNDQYPVIATDAEAVTLSYITRVHEGAWPPEFTALVIVALAVELCLSITGKTDMRQSLVNEREGLLIRAKNAIAGEGTPKQAPLPQGYLVARDRYGAEPRTRYDW